MFPKTAAFIVALFLGAYLILTGSLVIGLIFICLAILIPAS